MNKEKEKKEKFDSIFKKQDGSSYKEDDILCIDVKTLKEIFSNIESDTAFQYLRRFREEYSKIRNDSRGGNPSRIHLHRVQRALEELYFDNDGRHMGH